jgi:ABC-2 type transport system permease protein
MSENVIGLKTKAAASPLWLLVRVNVLQSWRRLLSIREQSRLLTIVIGLFILGYLGTSFWLFYKGMKFLTIFPGLGTVLTERLFYLLFAFLFGLLLLSNLVISYTNLFRNREAAFLLTMPISSQTIFRWKFIESTLLASWAFLFLIAPLLAAFGLMRGVPWHFYVMTVFLVGLFIILPGVAGVWLAIHIGRYLDRRSFQISVIVAALVLLIAAAFWWETQIPEEFTETRTLDVLDKLLIRTRFAMFPFMPAYWMSTSVLQWADGAMTAAGFFILVLLSHALFFGCLAFTRWGGLFYDTASEVQSRASVWGQWQWWNARAGRKSGDEPGPLEKVVGCLRWLNRDTQALVVKDVRMFWRDTTQWGQSAMLFGLLGIYIVNLRNFSHQMTSLFWVNLVSYLNLAACSLNLATVTTRFVFPQFSLEGRRLWIIGMSPMGLAKVVKIKYWLASAMSLAVTLSLNTLSCWLLKLSWPRMVFFGAVVAAMAFALNGLAVGLGVLYPNFKDANPGKIVSGFGGTLCLVLSFLYIVASVLLLVCGTNSIFTDTIWASASVSGFVILSILIGWLPMRLALGRLGKFEV